MIRLFVAIRPPEEVRDRLVDAMDDSPELRWVSDDNLHITLRFIGEVERPTAEDLAAALDAIRFPAFDLQLSGSGMFGRRGGGAVWVAVEPKDAISALANKVDRACQSAGLEPERRAFHPHLTLARYGRSSAIAAQDFADRNRALDAGRFRVNCFTLYESRLSRHGALYVEMASYALV